MMADHIPFVNGKEDARLLRKLYADSVVARLSLENLSKVIGGLPASTHIWVDSAIDGLQDLSSRNTRYKAHVSQFAKYDRIVDPSFQSAPDKSVVVEFVNSVMNACVAGPRKPNWISIPQLPVAGDSSRNKINKMLARATGEWRARQLITTKLILPIIFTHQDQTSLKTKRNGPISLAKACYNQAAADGIWVVECNLSDQAGSKSLDRRFGSIIETHKELVEALPSDCITVAGPYWGLNLILWARNLVRYPAISLGSGYRYYTPGGILNPPKEHFALSSLRRRAMAEPPLRTWLKTSAARIPAQESARQEFEGLVKNFDMLLVDWKLQVAKFYKQWFDELDAIPRTGRALALFQQLSSAYVLGKSLTELPKREGTARRPERVAQQLMMHCL